MENTCVIEYISKENKKYNINKIKNSIQSYSIDDIIDDIINDGKDIILEEKDIKYHLTSTLNENNNIHANISNINLGKCEIELKQKYNINLDQPLLIFKTDINIEGYSTPAVEYEVYHPITKEQLDLKLCNEDKIKISVPANINENEISKYNPKNDFYNDICSSYTTPYNTDITLKDRQQEFIDNNMTLCENNCDFISYNNTLKKVNCECDIKFSINDLYNIKIDKEKLKLKFNIKNLINIGVLKCYKLLFNKNGIIYNYGSYIILFIIFINIIGLFIFLFKDYESIERQVKNLFDENEVNITNILKEKKHFKKNTEMVKKQSNNKNITVDNPSKGKILLNNNNARKKINKHIKKIKTNLYIKNVDNIKNKNKQLPKSDYELNNSEFQDAIKYDKRTYCDYFLSLLKYNHLLVFAIVPSKDYNSKIIKISLFLFFFALEMANKALFFNEETMHNIYVKKGQYDFIYQIPEIIYSSLISIIIDTIIRYFSLTQKYIIEEKNKKNKENNKSKYENIMTNLKIKFIFYFIFNFLFLSLFWFYIACFCIVYKNTQIYLIKDTSISFGLSLIYPIISYLMSGIFRILSLRKKSEYIYKFSQFILF